MHTRRNWLATLLAAPAATSSALAAGAVIAEHDPGNIKLCHRVSHNISDDDLLFLKQIGLRWARVEFGDSSVSLDQLRATQQRFARFGLGIFSGVHYSYRRPDVQLGRAQRDRYIDEYRTFVRNLGTLGIPVANYDWHPANTYTTSTVEQPRGYKARRFSVDDFRAKMDKRAFDRDYSAEDIWATYAYFMKAVLPVAEEAGVKLALHPDDPPISPMNGVAKVLIHYDGYRRAEQIAGNSKHWGLTFCVGTWMEGGDRMGKDVFGMIADFGGRGKIVDVHFRNVTSPLPTFTETFPDDGYMDMYQIMKALRKVRFSGSAVPDHVPELSGDSGIRRAGTAYCIASMRALLRRANEEVG